MSSQILRAARRQFGPTWPYLDELRQELAQARRLVRHDEIDAASDVMLELTAAFHNVGYPQLVLAAVADMRAILGARITERVEGWALNLEALGAGAMGDQSRAHQALNRMLKIGRELNDPNL